MRNGVEAEFRRRRFMGKGVNGKIKTVIMGWTCECGREVGPDATLVKCIGCQGIRLGKLDPPEQAARERAMMKNAFAWT